jgi:hypothetical protein
MSVVGVGLTSAGPTIHNLVNASGAWLFGQVRAR